MPCGRAGRTCSGRAAHRGGGAARSPQTSPAHRLQPPGTVDECPGEWCIGAPATGADDARAARAAGATGRARGRARGRGLPRAARRWRRPDGRRDGRVRPPADGAGAAGARSARTCPTPAAAAARRLDDLRARPPLRQPPSERRVRAPGRGRPGRPAWGGAPSGDPRTWRSSSGKRAFGHPPATGDAGIAFVARVGGRPRGCRASPGLAGGRRRSIDHVRPEPLEAPEIASVEQRIVAVVMVHAPMLAPMGSKGTCRIRGVGRRSLRHAGGDDA